MRIAGPTAGNPIFSNKRGVKMIGAAEKPKPIAGQINIIE